MTAILGYASLLKEQNQSTGQDKQNGDFVDVIERNSQHLLSVIDDILNLAKIEAGKLTVEQIPISIPDLLTDLVALIKVQADVKQLAFEIELETPIPKTIKGDVVRLRTNTAEPSRQRIQVHRARQGNTQSRLRYRGRAKSTSK